MQVRYLKTYEYFEPKVIEDNEANKRVVFDHEGKQIQAYIYPATTSSQSLQYGKELNYMLNLLTNENKLKEGYGIKVFANQVDYVVETIKIYSSHFLVELKKCR